MATPEADLKKVRSEITRLEVQLAAAKERAVKLEHFIEMAKLYGVSPAAESAGTGSTPSAGARSGAVAVVVDILRESGKPMQTRDLVAELKLRGHTIGGQNPVTNLSGSLSRAKELVNDRLAGWKLREWAERPPVDPTLNPVPVPPISDPPDDSVFLRARDLDDEIPF